MKPFEKSVFFEEDELHLKHYSNGTYSYYSKKKGCHVNIPTELGELIYKLQKKVK